MDGYACSRSQTNIVSERAEVEGVWKDEEWCSYPDMKNDAHKLNGVIFSHMHTCITEENRNR